MTVRYRIQIRWQDCRVGVAYKNYKKRHIIVNQHDQCWNAV